LREFLDGVRLRCSRCARRGPLFDWSIYNDSVSLAPLVSKLRRARQNRAARLDAATCTEQLRALREPDAPPRRLAATLGCQPGLGCGRHGAADAASATAVSASIGISPSDAQPGGDPNAPVVRAKKLDDSACPSEPLPPIIVMPPAQSGGSGAPTPSGNTTVVVEETTVVDDGHSDVNCGGSPQPEPSDGYYDDSSSCSSDTSSTSSSDSSDSSCSGDSSSSSDANDSGCSSDTSSTSDSSSSSTDSGDSGCDSGSSESGYNGDTCSGSVAPGAEQTEKAQASLTSGGARQGRAG